MTVKKIRGLFRLFRFELPFTAGVCVVLGELLAIGGIPSAHQIILGFLSVFFISATALILNDYFDLETDRINAPERPLPSGQVTGLDVILLSSAVTLIGFITSLLISIEAFCVVLLVWAVGFLYNWRFKRTGLFGNLMVAFSVGSTFILGGIAVGKPFENIVWFFAVWVLLVDLGEEIAADAMDVEGDRKTGSRSLAVIFGSEYAIRISAAVFMSVVAGSALPLICGWMDLIYLIPILFTDTVILYSTVKLLDARIVNRRIFIRYIYLSGLAALLAIIILRMLH